MSLISSSSSSSSSYYKICLVLETEDYSKRFKYIYDVFVIDPCSGGGRRRRRPRLLLEPLFRVPRDYPILMGSFAFDSRIYFFGGYHEGFCKSRDVFVYDTSSTNSTIKKVSCMNHGKYIPVIIGPLRGKFYVTSCSLSIQDFERFDPKLDSWDHLCQPSVPYKPDPDFLEEYCIESYAVNNDSEILLSTPSGLFSYDIDKSNWSFYPEASIPFVNDTVSGSISIGRDRFLGFTKRSDDGDTSLGFRSRRGHMVLGLGTYRYNSIEHTWHDFELIYDWPQTKECEAFPMSLGGDLVCGVVSGYDRSARDLDDPEPCTHSVSIGIFGDGPKFKPLHFRDYKDKHNMKRCKRNVIACFPMSGVAPSRGMFCIPPTIGLLQDKITENPNSAISTDDDIEWSSDDTYMQMFDSDGYDLDRGVGTCLTPSQMTPSQKTIQSVAQLSRGLALAVLFGVWMFSNFKRFRRN